MIEKNDWRLTHQEDYLFGKKLMQIPYVPYRPGWEHDHCSFCFEKIDCSTKDAYCTEDQYHWICKECYEDFKDMFQWKFTNKNKE